MTDQLKDGLVAAAHTHQYLLTSAPADGGPETFAGSVLQPDTLDALRGAGVDHVALQLPPHLHSDMNRYLSSHTFGGELVRDPGKRAEFAELTSLTDRVREHGLDVKVVGTHNTAAELNKLGGKTLVLGQPELGARDHDTDELLGESRTARIEIYNSESQRLANQVGNFLTGGHGHDADPDDPYARYYRNSGEFDRLQPEPGSSLEHGSVDLSALKAPATDAAPKAAPRPQHAPKP